MKKRFLLAALLFSVIITAQTEKGTFMIRGETGLGFTSTNVNYKDHGQSTDGPKTTAFNVSPSVGFFVIDNLAIGLDFDYKTSTTKQHGITFYSTAINGYSRVEAESTETSLAIIPNATYFFSKGKARPFIEAGIGYANIKQKSEISDSVQYLKSDSNNNGYVWGAGGGLAYFITNTFSFDLGLAYSEYNYKEENIDVKSGAFSANIGISIFLK
jgi:outer membrane protein